LSIINLEKINISDILKQLRIYKDITLLKLSKDLGEKYNKIKNYEFDNKLPSNETLILIASFFDVSIDFILLSNSCNYIRNIEFIKFAEKIDKLNTDRRYKVESTIETFLKTTDKSNFDLINIEFKNNIHENIKILRTNKGVSQKELALELGLTSSAIGHYEIKKNPSPKNLVKLSNYFNVSAHVILTGNKLLFNFINKAFENTVLKADKQLSLEHQKFLIELMENIINS